MALLIHVIDGEEVDRFDINENGFTLGRLDKNYIQIIDDTVSGTHALISIDLNSYCRSQKEYYLEDLNSTNGTFVNGKQVSGAVRLKDGDLIRVAWCDFIFADQLASQQIEESPNTDLLFNELTKAPPLLAL
ncbi:MAG: FHA domain-containing protein [Cellvibrionaceae bacterium]